MTIGLKQAQLKLAELVQQAQPGDQIAIQRNGQIVAEIAVGARPVRRTPGRLKGKIHFVGDDDDSHLADFKDYM